MMRAAGTKGAYSSFKDLWVKDQKREDVTNKEESKDQERSTNINNNDTSTPYIMSDEELRVMIRHGEKLRVNIESDRAIFPQNVQIDPITGMLLSSYDGSKRDWKEFMETRIVADEAPHNPRPSIYI